MMKTLQSLCRILIVVLTTLLFYAAYAGVRLICLISGRPHKVWRNRCLTLWAATVAAFLNLKIEVSGEPPRPPFFLVSNHLSYLDIVVLYRYLDCTFVSMREVREWPVIGFMADTLGILFIDRKNRADVQRVNLQISEAIDHHQGVVIFPEGTTSSGDQIRHFRSSLLEPAAASGMGVHYAAISYRTLPGDQPASESVCWWGSTPLGTHVLRLTRNKGIQCRLQFGGESVIDSNRKTLSDTLHRRVSELYRGDRQRSSALF